MSFGDAVRICFQKYVTFTGRAGRPEFWYWVLFTVLAGIVIGILDGILHTRGTLRTLFNLAVLLPGLAVSVRRLHDIGRPGAFLLLLYVPGAVGVLFFLFAMAAGMAAVFGGGGAASAGFGAAAGLSALIGLVLVVAGFGFAIYTMAKPGQPGANAYGPQPGVAPLEV